VREKGKVRFTVPDSRLVGFGTVSTGESDVPDGNIAYIFKISKWKYNGFCI
jgi:hypothetical protein